MGTLNKIYNLVWYGSCDEDCVDLDLTSYKESIDFVFQVSDVNSGWKHWSSSTDCINVSDFDTLVCGVPYIVKLKSTDNIYPDKAIDIPGLVVGDYAADSSDATDLRVTDSCFYTPCTIEITDINHDDKTFMVTVYTDNLDPTNTNRMIQGAEFEFENVLFDTTHTIDPVTFVSIRNRTNNGSNANELYTELINRTKYFVDTDCEIEKTSNRFGWADLRDEATGIDYNITKRLKFKVKYKELTGTPSVAKIDVYDTNSITGSECVPTNYKKVQYSEQSKVVEIINGNTQGSMTLSFKEDGTFGFDSEKFTELSASSMFSVKDDTGKEVLQIMSNVFPENTSTVYFDCASVFCNGICYTGELTKIQGTNNYEVNLEKVPNNNPAQRNLYGVELCLDDTPTPTPSPSPTPFTCCDENDMQVRTNGPSVNNLTLLGNKEGTLCWKEMDGINLPKTYLCYFESNDNSNGAIKINITSNRTDNTFRFITDDGICYETELILEDNDGKNIFKRIN
jgi:hypothetical protein